mmetsp:Transcript_55699/g.145274  ORF Transcript_55699/g.145274 Transcript_55699/m.145274 type:complete len:291 (-) Transcript_55699:720-1592(-)
MLLASDFIHLCLPLHQDREFGLQLLHLGLEPCRSRSGLVDFGGHLGEVVVQLPLLCLGLRHLLVAICLLRRFASSLIFQLCDHVRDQCLHLGEGILPSGRAEAEDSRNARGQLRKCRRVVFLGQPLDQGDDFHVGEVGTCAQTRCDSSATLELKEGVRLINSSGCSARQQLLGFRNHGKLLLTGSVCGLVICRGLHAIGIRELEPLLAVSDVLDCLGKVALGCSFRLGGSCFGGFLIIQIIVVGCNLIFKRLFQHLVVMFCVGLGLTETAQLLLCLLLQILEDLDDVVAM